MIEFNDEHEQIEITEVLSFENHILPFLNDIRDDLEYENCHVNLSELNDEEKYALEKIDDFLNHQLTHEDKMEILHYIEDQYKCCCNYFDNASIFDSDMIKKCVMTWITDNFDIEF